MLRVVAAGEKKGWSARSSVMQNRQSAGFARTS
jgi:hypothetical protein